LLKGVCDVGGERANTVIGKRSRTDIYRVSGVVKRPHCVVEPFLPGSVLDRKPRIGGL